MSTQSESLPTNDDELDRILEDCFMRCLLKGESPDLHFEYTIGARANSLIKKARKAFKEIGMSYDQSIEVST